MNETLDPQLQTLLKLNRLIHEPARLAFLTVLASADEVAFKFLETVTGMSKGNLSSHSSKLEEAGYIEVIKGFQGRKPVTKFKLTPTGRAALAAYWQQLHEAFPEAPKPQL